MQNGCDWSTHRKRFSLEGDPFGAGALGDQILSARGLQVGELLDTLAEAITIRDPDDQIVYANSAALDHLGFATLEDLQARSLDSVMDDYIVRDEHGDPLQMSDVPSVRLLRGQPAQQLLMQTVHRQTGELRWDILKTAGLRDSTGNLRLAVTVIEDLTAIKAAEVQMRILSEAGRLLASSLDLEQTLRNIAEVPVPDIADWCVVDLIDVHARTREQIAVAHRNPDKRELFARVRQFRPGRFDRESTLGHTALTGEPALFFDLDDVHLQRVARDDEELQLLRALEIRSALVVPMRFSDRAVGMMTLGTSESMRKLTVEDLDLAVELAQRAASAVETSRLHTTIRGVAETLQQSLLPSDPPPVPGWELASLYRPAHSPQQRIEVGGDFYEVFDAGSNFLALIGDVTGHGVTAATVTSLLRYGARFASRLEPRPAAILHRLDQELRDRPGLMLSTALCVRFGPGELVLSSAGHPPALVVDGEGKVTEAPEPGPLLGAFADARWVDHRIPITPDQLVLLYTDGVTETVGATERFGLGRLRELVARHSWSSPQQLLDSLAAELDEFRDGEAGDDVAALALRPRP